jgi:hypothetical protein
MKGVWGEQWDYCDRCGFVFPISQLQKQKGLLVCSKDLDDLSIERRDGIIAQVLADGREGDNPKAEKLAEDDSFPELEF